MGHMKSWWVHITRNSLDSFVCQDATYFDSFGANHVSKEIEKLRGKKNIITNIYRIQACNSIICRCFCIGFIGLCKKEKVCQIILIYFLLQYENNDKINIFSMAKKLKMKKI